jgi:hypothetical protein
MASRESRCAKRKRESSVRRESALSLSALGRTACFEEEHPTVNPTLKHTPTATHTLFAKPFVQIFISLESCFFEI